jgi:hypothetical protein
VAVDTMRTAIVVGRGIVVRSLLSARMWHLALVVWPSGFRLG